MRRQTLPPRTPLARRARRTMAPFVLGSLALHAALCAWTARAVAAAPTVTVERGAATARLAVRLVPPPSPTPPAVTARVEPEASALPPLTRSARATPAPTRVSAPLDPPGDAAPTPSRAALALPSVSIPAPPPRALAPSPAAPDRAFAAVALAPAVESIVSEAQPDAAAEADAGAVEGEARPDPRRSPRPAYPRLARLRRQEGTVTLLVDVAASGAVERVAVELSSGFPLLDEAAAAAVGAWSFTPAFRGAAPVRAQARVPVTFRLVDR